MTEMPVVTVEERQETAPLSTRLGPIHIAVTDGARALPVWRDLVGLTVLAQDDRAITLGAGGVPLVVLEPGAERPVMERTTGLYHVAIHVPTRGDLARVVARCIQAKWRTSPTDHLVTETTYLWDPDGNGIEITFETPWRGRLNDDLRGGFLGTTVDGRPHSGREPVDLESLFGELKAGEDLAAPLPAGTRIGHVHVHVGDLDRAMQFYAGTLGFQRQMLSHRFGMGDVRTNYEPHILAFNIWQGEGAPQPPAGSAGLRWYTIVLPDAASLQAMRGRLVASGAPMTDVEGGFHAADPWGNRIRVEL